jgi:hypothetical protein
VLNPEAFKQLSSKNTEENGNYYESRLKLFQLLLESSNTSHQIHELHQLVLLWTTDHQSLQNTTTLPTGGHVVTVPFHQCWFSLLCQLGKFKDEESITQLLNTRVPSWYWKFIDDDSFASSDRTLQSPIFLTETEDGQLVQLLQENGLLNHSYKWGLSSPYKALQMQVLSQLQADLMATPQTTSIRYDDVMLCMLWSEGHSSVFAQSKLFPALLDFLSRITTRSKGAPTKEEWLMQMAVVTSVAKLVQQELDLHAACIASQLCSFITPSPPIYGVLIDSNLALLAWFLKRQPALLNETAEMLYFEKTNNEECWTMMQATIAACQQAQENFGRRWQL